MIEELMKLPFEIQLVMAAGYMAYRVASSGLDRAHKTADIVFQVFVYGLVAYLSYDFVLRWVSTAPAMGVGIIGSIAVASFWRAIGRQIFVAIVRKSKITRENFTPSTWDHILQSRYQWAYVSVACDDAKSYESNLQALPKGLPFDFLDLDTDGNIAIYVTRIIQADGSAKDFGIEGVVDEYGRAQLTYIPVSSIKNVTISLGSNVATS
ncbi:MAG: hypothetical protein RIB80_11520 [Rhodospirillales bacterium]